MSNLDGRLSLVGRFGVGRGGNARNKIRAKRFTVMVQNGLEIPMLHGEVLQAAHKLADQFLAAALIVRPHSLNSGTLILNLRAHHSPLLEHEKTANHSEQQQSSQRDEKQSLELPVLTAQFLKAGT